MFPQSTVELMYLQNARLEVQDLKGCTGECVMFPEQMGTVDKVQYIHGTQFKAWL